jgi:hypothetical protein
LRLLGDKDLDVKLILCPNWLNGVDDELMLLYLSEEGVYLVSG